MKWRVLALAAALVLTAGCSAGAVETPGTGAGGEVDGAPKYIFLFIGDGMSYPQIQAASYYLGATASDGGVERRDLSFMNFPVAGSATTYNCTSFAPDSASTATAIASGEKTYSGAINMDTTYTVAFETISEKLAAQREFAIGIVTSVNLNHATPAAFYAHQPSRSNYYDIGLELIDSGFTYFAGGAPLSPTGADGDQTDLLELAAGAGYTVATTRRGAEALANGQKSVVVAETLADGGAMSYSMDAAPGEWVLADYVKKGIEVLDNETGFFMVVEGGKIDWAGHANDAAANIHDTIALSDAVGVAVDFYHANPDDTLILVTGDHETGGLSIGFAGTDYDTYLVSLEGQTISYAKYDRDYVAGYRENGTSFARVLEDIGELFGLVTEEDGGDSALVLTDWELERLRAAYDRTMDVGIDTENMTQEEYLLYGPYEPLSVTVTHLLANKSGIGWTSYVHTGLPVPVFALGTGAERFQGYYDNTDIYHNLARLTGVQ